MKIRIDAGFEYSSGYATVARQFSEQLYKRNKQLSVNNIQGYKDPKYTWDHELTKTYTDKSEKEVVMMWATPNNRSVYITKPNEFPLWEDTKKIHYFVWELNKIPELWTTFLEDIDTDIIYTPSKFSQNAIKKSTNIQSNIIPHGYNPNVYKHKKVKKQNRFVALYVGTWIKRKGALETILSAVDALKNTDSEVWIKLNYDANTIKQIKRNIQTSVVRTFTKMQKVPKIRIFTGHMSEKEMNNMYNKADVVISGSRGEGWNMPLLESIATKTPVVTTNKGGQMDFISSDYKYLTNITNLTMSNGREFYGADFGLKWHEVDYQNMSKQIFNLYQIWLNDNEKMLEIGSELYDNAKMFTWSNAVEKYIKDVNNLLL